MSHPFNPLRPIAQLAVLVAIVLLLGFSVAVVGAFWVLYGFGRGLPDYHQLAEYSPSCCDAVVCSDGQLVAEYAVENRVFVPIEAIPQHVTPRVFVCRRQGAFIAIRELNRFRLFAPFGLTFAYGARTPSCWRVYDNPAGRQKLSAHQRSHLGTQNSRGNFVGAVRAGFV